jgi:hypothetical protein
MSRSCLDPSKLAENDFTRLLEPGVGSAAGIEALEQMIRFGLGAGEMIPVVLPPIAVDFGVQLL